MDHQRSELKLSIVEFAQHPAYLSVISLLRWPERISEWGCGSRTLLSPGTVFVFLGWGPT